ncbi:MAG: hypothetical protein WC402_03015 [Candidatus Pacearchaeota archaeon]|jgi:hypothetical protein
MSKPILLVVRKKTKVLSRRQINHEFRSDWKLKCKVDYWRSRELFFEIGGGPIKTDAQFVKLVLEEFGEGEYSVIYWMKGRKGFRSFIHFIVDSEGYFKQVKAGVYKNKRKLNLEDEYCRAKFEYQESKTESNWDEMQNLQKKIDRADHAQGPYPILESLQPRYRVHKIEGVEDREEIEEQEEDNSKDEKEPEYSLW